MIFKSVTASCVVCFLHRQICVITDNHDRKQEGDMVPYGEWI